MDVDLIARELLVGVGLLVRQLRQLNADEGLTFSETSALARLDRGGATTVTALAKLEQISTQSMGATVGALERRGLIGRHPDPADGRQAYLSVTEAGRAMLRTRRDARAQALARALARGFTHSELKRLEAAAPLIERLAQLPLPNGVGAPGDHVVGRPR